MKVSCAILLILSLSAAAAAPTAADYPRESNELDDRGNRVPVPTAIPTRPSRREGLLKGMRLGDYDCIQLSMKKNHSAAESFYRIGAERAQFINNNTIIAPLDYSSNKVTAGLLNLFTFNMNLFSDEFDFTNGSSYQYVKYYNSFPSGGCESNVCGDYIYQVMPANCPTIPTTCYAYNTDFYPDILQTSTANFYIDYYQQVDITHVDVVACLDFNQPFGFATYNPYNPTGETNWGLQYFWYDGHGRMFAILNGQSNDSWNEMTNVANLVWCFGQNKCVSFIPV